jgi:hypothetical protein
LWIAAHAEIVVGAPYSHTLVGVLGVSFREFLGQAVDIVEVAVRLVLVLLVKLGFVETFIIKFGGDWGSGLSSTDGGDFALVNGVLDWTKSGNSWSNVNTS